MAIFNIQQLAEASMPDVKNKAGGAAFKVDPRYELASILLTSFLKDKFYRTASDEVTRLKELLQIVDRKFAAKAAIYARDKFNMRSITHVVAGELCARVGGTDWGRRFYDRIVYRLDDMFEILSYYFANNAGKTKIGKKHPPISNAMKFGFAKAILRFDEYQLAKYRAEDKSVSLIDVVNLVRPVGRKGLRETTAKGLKKLVKGTLRSEKTFESVIAGAGQKEAVVETKEEKTEIRSDAWDKLIKDQSIGYTALLKNLSNIALQSPKSLTAALGLLRDEKMIRKSKVFPFQYYTAWEEIQKTSIGPIASRGLLEAIADAVEIAVGNVPKLPGKTLIALDKSGSMTDQLKIASQLAAVLYRANDAALCIFDDSAKWLKTNARESLISLQKTILLNCDRNGGTSFHSVFDLALTEFKQTGEAFDRIIFISDEQHWAQAAHGNPQTVATTYRRFCKAVKSRPAIYMIDTQGLGTMQFPEDKVYAVAGFSEKLFELMGQLEQDRSALVNAIEAVEL